MARSKITVDVDVADLKDAIKTPLTPLQHKFVMEYLKDKKGAAAMERAGAKGTKHTFKTLAHQMLKQPSVAKAIEEAEGKITERAALSQGDIINYFLDTAQEARTAKKFDAAVKSYEKVAEMYGYLKKVTKKEEDELNKNKLPKASEAFGNNGDSQESHDVNEDIGEFLKKLSYNTNNRQ